MKKTKKHNYIAVRTDFIMELSAVLGQKECSASSP